jgi:hypothetical protein
VLRALQPGLRFDGEAAVLSLDHRSTGQPDQELRALLDTGHERLVAAIPAAWAPPGWEPYRVLTQPSIPVTLPQAPGQFDFPLPVQVMLTIMFVTIGVLTWHWLVKDMHRTTT